MTRDDVGEIKPSADQENYRKVGQAISKEFSQRTASIDDERKGSFLWGAIYNK